MVLYKSIIIYYYFYTPDSIVQELKTRLAGVALVQFGGDQKTALESHHQIVSLDRQGDLLEKIHRFTRVSCNDRQSVAQLG